MEQGLPEMNNRIRLLIDKFANGNVKKFAEALDNISQQRLNRIFLKDKRTGKFPGIPEEIITAIPKKFPVNTVWLLTGEGNMILSDETAGYLEHAPPGRFPKKRDGDKVLFFDVDFAAGDIEFYDNASGIKPAYTMDIPDFNGCTAFRTYGDSMEKLIKSGSIIFGTKIEDWHSHLEYGQIYGIVCTDGRKYMKYIKKAKVKGRELTHFLLHSENQQYEDFAIPKDKIKSIWLIHGWLNKKV